MARVTNLEKRQGSLAGILAGADVFIGVSAPGAVTKEMVQTMAKDAIIFACANPTPEIFPGEAKAGGAAVVATGRSDFPNQINNVLAFPGIFRGAFDVRARDINEAMKMAAQALAGLIAPEELSSDYIIPAAFDPWVGKAVAATPNHANKRRLSVPMRTVLTDVRPVTGWDAPVASFTGARPNYYQHRR